MSTVNDNDAIVGNYDYVMTAMWNMIILVVAVFCFLVVVHSQYPSQYGLAIAFCISITVISLVGSVISIFMRYNEERDAAEQRRTRVQAVQRQEEKRFLFGKSIYERSHDA